MMMIILSMSQLYVNENHAKIKILGDQINSLKVNILYNTYERETKMCYIFFFEEIDYLIEE